MQPRIAFEALTPPTSGPAARRKTCVPVTAMLPIPQSAIFFRHFGESEADLPPIPHSLHTPAFDSGESSAKCASDSPFYLRLLLTLGNRCHQRSRRLNSHSHPPPATRPRQPTSRHPPPHRRAPRSAAVGVEEGAQRDGRGRRLPGDASHADEVEGESQAGAAGVTTHREMLRAVSQHGAARRLPSMRVEILSAGRAGRELLPARRFACSTRPGGRSACFAGL
jgi:hypothetical protein